MTKQPHMKILGIETSCDETGVAIYGTEKGLRKRALFSSCPSRTIWRVIPEVASRSQLEKMDLGPLKLVSAREYQAV